MYLENTIEIGSFAEAKRSPLNELTQYDERGDARKLSYILEDVVMKNEADAEKSSQACDLLGRCCFRLLPRYIYHRLMPDSGCQGLRQSKGRYDLALLAEETLGNCDEGSCEHSLSER